MYFDAHSDIWCDVADRRLAGETEILRKYHLDRLRRGGVEGAIFALWAEAPAYTERTAQLMDCAAAEIAACGEIAVVHSCAEMEAAVRAGKFYVFIGVEGMAAIGTDLTGIDRYYDFGARHAMLTWNEENALATGAHGDPDRGLTELGRRAVEKMQEKRMLVDVSHLNEKSFWDLMDCARGPVIASHSNAKALCGAARNLTDDQLRAIRDTGGAVGLNVCGRFVDEDVEKRTVRRLAEHAAHMIDVCGIECVGCGFDFCEFLKFDPAGDDDSLTVGLEDCSHIPNLFACFEEMGMRQTEMEQIARGNFHRVLRAVVG